LVRNEQGLDLNWVLNHGCIFQRSLDENGVGKMLYEALRWDVRDNDSAKRIFLQIISGE
jgi:hypothetical protein